MSNKITWKSSDENTLFPLSMAQERFLKEFGVEIKSKFSLRRWANGVQIPVTGEIVRLECKYSPGGGKLISLKIYNDFLDKLNEAYQRAYSQEESE